LQQRLDLTQLDYVILGHVNPNRAVTLKALLELAPQTTFVVLTLARLICVVPCQITIENYRDAGRRNSKFRQGSSVAIHPHPQSTIPDELCTYDPQTEILYTDKLFGAHICGDQVFDEGMGDV
jgi:flavorubredoxin